MLSELQVTALRNDLAQQLFVLEGAPAPDQDEGDEHLAADRAARAGRLRMAVDVLTTVLVGGA